MSLVPRYKWECQKCQKQKDAHLDPDFPNLGAVPEYCPECGGQMTLHPIVHRGPSLEQIHKKY